MRACLLQAGVELTLLQGPRLPSLPAAQVLVQVSEGARCALACRAACAAPRCCTAAQLGEQLATNGSVVWKTPSQNSWQDAWLFPAFNTSHSVPAAQLAAFHHEYSEFRCALESPVRSASRARKRPPPLPCRYIELIMTDAATGSPLDVAPSAFNLTVWRVHYPYADGGAATVSTASPALDAVWRLCAYTVKATTLDVYTGARALVCLCVHRRLTCAVATADSNTRQRSSDCMADDTTAILGQYATSAELALPRLVASQIMAMGPQGEGFCSASQT